MENFNLSRVTVEVDVWHQFSDADQASGIIKNTLNFPAVEQVNVTNIQKLNPTDAKLLSFVERVAVFEKGIKQCTLYSTERNSGGDGPMYVDERTNSALWGFECAYYQFVTRNK